MDVKITCLKCKQSFTLQEKYLKDKDKLVCPNCNCPFPQAQFDDLKKAVEHLTLAKRHIQNQFQECIKFELVESSPE